MRLNKALHNFVKWKWLKECRSGNRFLILGCLWQPRINWLAKLCWKQNCVSCNVNRINQPVDYTFVKTFHPRKILVFKQSIFLFVILKRNVFRFSAWSCLFIMSLLAGVAQINACTEVDINHHFLNSTRSRVKKL